MSSIKYSKVQEYLQSNNYEMAITTYNNNPEQLSEHVLVQLARAFLINQNYEKCLELCDKIKNSSDVRLYFEANVLLVKSGYLCGQKVGGLLRDMEMRVGKEQFTNQRKWCLEVIRELKEVIDYETDNNAAKMSKYQLREFGKKFKQLYQKQQFENPLTDCMPMFVVSARWLKKFQDYVGSKENAVHPGPITHFEILDHRYNMLYDPTPQKKYTNYLIYPGSTVITLPRSCWEMLRKTFKGIQLKRYNIWVSGKPRQVITEIYLKKIKLKKLTERQIYEVQITKKQTWGGVTKKIKNIWKNCQNSVIMQEGENNLMKPVQQNVFLEQVNTIDKVFIFGQLPPAQQKSSPTTAAVNNPLLRCNFCKKTQNLKFCQCKSVKYCDRQCQKEDREKHRKKCEKEMSYLNQKSAIMQNFNLPERSYGGRKGLVGLRNLGNTCYMNSGLQCLSNTKQITEYFMTNEFLKEINQSNPLGTKGNLSCAYAQLIREMWTGTDSSISPFNLKKIIGKFSPQFSGYGQQDSQELISSLIDGLQQDLNLVKKKQTFQTPDQIIPDEEASLKSQQNYEKRVKSYIRDLMVGQFKSTVICDRCQKTSICFDPYLLLTLPIPAAKQHEVFYISSDCSKSTKKLTFISDNFSRIGHLREELNNYYDVGSKYGSHFLFAIVQLKKYSVLDFDLKDSVTINEIHSKISASDVVLLAYEIIDPKNNNEATYQVEYTYKDEVACFPRFVTINKNTTSNDLVQILEKSVTRYYKQSKYSRESSKISDLIEKPEIISAKKIRITLKTRIDMLVCSSEHKTLKLNGGERRTSLYDCLNNFTHTQTLQDNNKWYCNKCKEHVKASKQMEIYKSNQILVLAFKRFSRGFKVKDMVDFPIEGLDIGPYIKSNKDKKPIVYDLYGVVNHYGTMSGGHYTAYCKNFLSNEWYEFDDSRVSKINPKDSVSESAYVLFYRRRG